MSFAFEKIPRSNLHSELVPVQHQEYEYLLLKSLEQTFMT